MGGIADRKERKADGDTKQEATEARELPTIQR